MNTQVCFYSGSSSAPATWEPHIPNPFFIVAENLFCLEQIEQAYPRAPKIHLSSGEATKSFTTVECICDALLKAGADKTTTIVAIGGGSVLDVSGFVASIYHRGIEWVAIPTTLLAQVDAAIGGKTAINIGGYKNIIGAFHAPHTVVIDTHMLNTLPYNLFAQGLAEVIKAGLLDTQLFAFLDSHIARIVAREKESIEKMVAHAVRVKKSIVEADPFDKGVRNHLNLGHTLAHAIEIEHKLSHGEAVAIGLHFALFLSESLLNTPLSVRKKIGDWLQLIGLPYALPLQANIPQLMYRLAKDKKHRAGKIRFIGLKDIGQPQILEDINSDLLADKLAEFKACYLQGNQTDLTLCNNMSKPVIEPIF